ncbi:hypothetical protein RHS03_04809, partial [Rhizoctonia solani]
MRGKVQKVHQLDTLPVEVVPPFRGNDSPLLAGLHVPAAGNNPNAPPDAAPTEVTVAANQQANNVNNQAEANAENEVTADQLVPEEGD